MTTQLVQDRDGYLINPTTSAAIGESSAGPQIRVLHALGQLQRGGIETWIYHLAQRLKPYGIDCHVLTRTAGAEPYTQDFLDAGITLLPCPGERNPPLYFKNLRQIIHEHGPYDILHSHGPSVSTIQLSLYARLLGVPSVLLHSHSDPRPLLKNANLGYRLYRRSFVRLGRLLATHQVACSSLAAEWMYGMRWNEHLKTKVLPLGIDFTPFFSAPDPQLRASLGLPAQKFVIGHVGRYVPVKNHAYIVKIAEALLRRGAPVHFLLVGDGPLRTSVEESVRAKKMDQHFTVIRDSNQVPALMGNAMDMFLLPSIYEGFGLSVVEAQVAGLRCLIGDKIPSEAVIDPRLVTRLPVTADPDAWADTIVALRQSGLPQFDREEHKSNMLACKFNIDSSVAAFARLYRNLAAGRRS